MMDDLIGERIVSAIGDIVPVFFSEAETESYPYAVFTEIPQFAYAKDGAYKIVAEVALSIVAKSFDEADALSTSVVEALLDGINADAFACRLTSSSSICDSGIWSITNNFLIRQLNNQ